MTQQSDSKGSNSVNIIGFVHKNGIWVEHRERLQNGVFQAYKEIVNPNAKLKMIWMQMPEGQAYLAGKPSTASTLATPMPDGFDQQTRVRFMDRVCADWMEATGCSIDEIIVNAMDQSASQGMQKLMASRFNPKQAKGLGLKLLFTALKSKFSKGYLSIETNLP